jgi:glutamine---fructose-6-phosphate transaminase (isomerizing)
VESLGRFPDSFLDEIVGQPAAIRRAAAAMDGGQRDRLAQLASAAGSRPRVTFTGMGASHFAGYVPVTSLAGWGVAALHLDAAELLHFRLPALGGDSVLILTSQSGESVETLAVAERLRARPASMRPLLVSVTNGPTNALAGLADIAFDTGAGIERGPSTLTFAASLVVLTAIARSLRSGAGTARSACPDDLAGAADAAGRAAEDLLTDDPPEPAGRIWSWFGGRPMLVTLGRGRARAASEMGALVLKEAAMFPAEALEAAQFRHGPLELSGPRLAAFVVATEPATEALDLTLAADLAGWGAAVLVAGREAPVQAPLQGLRLGALHPCLAPAVAVIPMQLLAWRLSAERGLDPTDLRVASKVTTRE